MNKRSSILESIYDVKESKEKELNDLHKAEVEREKAKVDNYTKSSPTDFDVKPFKKTTDNVVITHKKTSGQLVINVDANSEGAIVKFIDNGDKGKLDSLTINFLSELPEESLKVLGNFLDQVAKKNKEIDS